ncbi:uncharacterized protein LOC122511372 [Leptopilina heterotoma]|uniref:uncharacterized protein LOC122511372 n=1 Tax=Leptopilina heterotoma TaxID=63436 RepID=UPI001CA7B6CF|nr:uncharacterized protein LOC122511372 [Leptopilina heterotoma]XP_043482497.1 uncharacterized protein LOC122511372 [Leptopilina heterotoma]
MTPLCLVITDMCSEIVSLLWKGVSVGSVSAWNKFVYSENYCASRGVKDEGSNRTRSSRTKTRTKSGAGEEERRKQLRSRRTKEGLRGSHHRSRFLDQQVEMSRIQGEKLSCK